MPELSDHTDILKQLESIIEARHIEAWTTDVETWEADSTASNPFEPRTKGTLFRGFSMNRKALTAGQIPPRMRLGFA